MTTPRDRLPIVIAAVATGRTYPQAAELAGVSERTVRRLLDAPGVREQVAAERVRLAQEVADALTGLVPAALDRLRRITDVGTDRDAVNAARVIVTEARAWRDAPWAAARLRPFDDADLDRQIVELVAQLRSNDPPIRERLEP